MNDRNGPLTIALLAVPESTASTLYGMYDLFRGTGADWSLLTTGQGAEPLIEPVIASADGRRFRAANGLAVEPSCSLAQCPSPPLVVVPDLYLPPDAAVAGRYPRERDWLRRLHAQGATLAAACSGALLLAEAGLLDGRDATTHWAYCDAMAEQYPRVRMHPNRGLVVSGEGQRLIMAGGGTSWHDLALFLIARFVGTEEAMQAARVHLLDWHHVGQQPFATLCRRRQVGDAVIARCQEWIAEHYEQDSPVAAMVRLSGLAERSFKRRFARATGMSPLEYVHALRLEETKQMLESTSLSIEQIAHEVGYGDASFFGRLFRRKVGLTPAHYRKRFQTLRRKLEDSYEVAAR